MSNMFRSEISLKPWIGNPENHMQYLPSVINPKRSSRKHKTSFFQQCCTEGKGRLTEEFHHLTRKQSQGWSQKMFLTREMTLKQQTFPKCHWMKGQEMTQIREISSSEEFHFGDSSSYVTCKNFLPSPTFLAPHAIFCHPTFQNFSPPQPPKIICHYTPNNFPLSNLQKILPFHPKRFSVTLPSKKI